MSPILVGEMTAKALHLSLAGVIRADGSQDICDILLYDVTHGWAVNQWLTARITDSIKM